MIRSLTSAAIVALAVGIVGAGARSRAQDGTTAVVPTAASADRVHVNLKDGLVHGQLAPLTPVTVSVLSNGVTKATASTTTDASGSYVVSVQYDAGHGPGIHNGDTVVVTNQGSTYTQVVQLAGLLEEDTGLFTGTARPNALLAVKLYTNGTFATLPWSGTIKADATGKFRFDFSRVTRPKRVNGRPAWRGYVAWTDSRDQAGQALFNTIQTPNTTLTATRNHAGGGFFLPGDTVTFQLVRNASVVTSATTTADADGIPQAVLNADVGDGDVLVTTYHDAAGRARTQRLSPWKLTAAIDLVAGVVYGQTEPNAPVFGEYFAPDGNVKVVHAPLADASGNYTIDYRAAGIAMIANRFFVVDRIAEPGFTGVGAQQLEMMTPGLGLEEIGATVSGHGVPGVNPVRVQLVRNGTTVASALATTGKDGGFWGLALGQETLPGDDIVATVGGQAVPTLHVGSPFVAHAQYTGTGPLGWAYTGTATPGRQVVVLIALGNGSQCKLNATVGPDGNWSVDIPCPLAGNESVQVEEDATVAAGDGAAAGSSRWRFQNAVAPDVTLVAPPPGATVPATAVLQAEAYDVPEGMRSAEVWFCVDGAWVAASPDGGGGPTFSAAVTLASGAHNVFVVAYDGLGKTDAAGARIYAQTAARLFYVS